MTGNEIIKALECCGNERGNRCSKCPHYSENNDYCQEGLHRYALDLINRQNEKICKLEDELRRAKSEISKFYDQADDYCNEAIDVFADSLKIKLNRMIDNLAKEMKEVEE